MSFFPEMIKRLTDVYKKNPLSNIGKIIKILTDEMDELKETFERIEEWENVDKAEGLVLDDHGENVVQARGSASDEVYRIMLKSKVARNLSDGAINTIIRVLAIALNVKYKEIRIKELYNDSENPEPAAIGLIQIPMRRLNEVGMSAKQFVAIVQKTVGSGIRVANVELTGTFQFSSKRNEIEMDNTKGFADIDQTTGGFFGALFTDSDDTNIPV